MKVPRLKFTVDECMNNIRYICNDRNIVITHEDKNNHIVLNLIDDIGRNGMIRIYDSKNGRTLDGSQKDKEFNTEVLTIFETLYCGNNSGSIVDKRAVYTINGTKLDIFKLLIENTAVLNGYKVEVVCNTDSSIYYRMRINGSELKDRITVTQYNSGRLLIQGTGWQTWDDICEPIERKLNSSVQEVLIRYIPTQKDEKIENIITSALLISAEGDVKSRLGTAYDFIYPHDRTLIVSSKAQFIVGANYGDYYCYIAPALKVIEGYLIKTIVDLNLKTETEILEVGPNGKPKFNFGQIFHGNSHVYPAYKNLLRNTTTSIDQKEKELLKIYDKYSWCRSPYQHDGIPPIDMVSTYEDAESIYDEIIGTIKTSYNILFV